MGLLQLEDRYRISGMFHLANMSCNTMSRQIQITFSNTEHFRLSILNSSVLILFHSWLTIL